MKRSFIVAAIFALFAVVVAACSSNSTLPNVAATPASLSHKNAAPIGTDTLNFDDYGDPCQGGSGTVCGGSSDWSPPLAGGGGGGGYNPGCPLISPRKGRRVFCITGGGGGSTPQPAPIPSSSPGCTNGSTSAQDIDNTAEKQVHDHLASSILQNQEWGGFIYQNNVTGALAATGQYYNTDPVTGEAIGWPASPPGYYGWTPVAWFHDHPTNYADTDNPTGIQGPNQVPLGDVYSDNYLSADDESYSNSNNIDGYVGLKNEYGSQWAKWAPGGTVGQQTNYTNEEGLGTGC